VALLGEAFVRVRPDTDGFEQEASGKIGGGLRRVAGAVTAAFGAIKVGGFLKDAIGEASSYNETVSKAANIFGAQIAPEIQRFAKTAPQAFGISEAAALGATAQFGNMFRQLGFTSEAAAGASTNLIKTAADLGSFNNVDPSDVLERIGASLRGEFDSLQQLIPNINAARVEQEALALTGKKVASELTAQEKATATLSIIQKDGALAANDFAETSGGLANQQRILAATVDGLQQRLGQVFLPVVTKVVSFLTANAEPAFNRVEAAIRSNSAAGSEARKAFDTVKDGVVKFFRSVQSGEDVLPDLSGALTVGSAALKLVANNADLVAKALPFLAAAFVVVKTAQAAGNVAALASLPIQAAQVVSNFAAAAANRSLATAIAGQTAIQNANAIVTTRGTVATLAGTVATTASTVAKGIATVATGALTVATTALGAAIRFALGPVGLIITGVGLLAGGLVLAYQKSETFRNIVNAALDAVKGAFLGLGSAALGIVDAILGGYQRLAEAAGRLPGPLGEPFRAAAGAIGVAREGVQALQGRIEGLRGKNVSVDADTSPAERAVDGLISRIGRRNGVITVSARALERRAVGGPVRRRSSYLVGEKGPELFTPEGNGRISTANQTQRMLGGGGGGPAVYIAEAVFTDGADVDLLLSRTEFAVSAGRIGG
jgi:hypothetical protein